MKAKKWLLAACALIAAVLIGWITWSNGTLMVSRYTVTSGKLPEAFDGFQIAQVSDLHNAEFGADNEKLLALLSEAKPDIIVLTGDLVDSRRTDVEVALTFARQAAQIAPTYYVSGNHEARISQYGDLKAGLQDVGVTVLEDEKAAVTISGVSVTLLGVKDPSFSAEYLVGDEAAITAEALEELAGEEHYQILLAHRPELFGVYADRGIDLVFSGHAHGGQIRLPFVGGLVAPGQGFFPEYDKGLYTRDETSMVVSRGLGNSLFPFRVNNRPEVVVVQLKSE